jgi:hypothetical protein
MFERRMDNLEEQYEFNLSMLDMFKQPKHAAHITFVRDVTNGMRLEHNLDIATGILSLFLLCIKDTGNFDLGKDVVEEVASVIYGMKFEDHLSDEDISKFITGLIEETQRLTNEVNVEAFMREQSIETKRKRKE